MDLLEEPAAIKVPATRRSLGLRLAVFGLVLLVGVALVAVAAGLGVHEARVATSVDDGVTSTATVVAVAARPVNHRLNDEGTVTLEHDVAGATKQADVKVLRVDRFRVGDDVDIRYAADDPSNVAIVGDDRISTGIPAAVVGGFALMLVLMGATALLHLVQAARILRRNEWLAMPATVRSLPFEVGLRQRSLRVVIVQDPAELRAVSAEPVGLRRLPDEVAPLTWVAGLGGRRFVVAPPGGGSVVLVEQLRRRRRLESTDDLPGGRTGRRHHHGLHRHGRSRDAEEAAAIDRLEAELGIDPGER